MTAFLLVTGSVGAQVPPAPESTQAPPEDAERSETGLAWKVVKEGDGRFHPDDNDLVRVSFTGWTAAGRKVYSTIDEGKTAMFDMATAFPGWKEAIQSMVQGDERIFWIPPELGPKNAKGGAERAVVFQIELAGIGHLPNPPDDMSELPADGARTPSGAVTELVQKGSGEEYPGPDSVALVHYIGWRTNGKSFDASYPRGRPTAFPLDKVMPAFAEGVQQMVEGEKRRIWIPGNVAAGNWTGSPRGTLVFEVELIRIMPGSVLQTKPKDESAPAGGGE